MYRVLISVKVNARTKHTVASLLDTGGGPNVGNSLFVPPNWRSYVRPVRNLQLRNVTKQAVLLRGLISLKVFMGDIHACAWFVIVDNLVGDQLLGKPYIDLCMCGI